MMSILRSALVGLSASWVAALPAIAQPSPQPPVQTPTLPGPPMPLVEPDDTAETVQYSDEVMAVDYPVNWQVAVIDNGVMISSVPEAEADLVATQIVRIAAPPGPVVNANLDSFAEEGSAVGRYRKVEIDGQSALVMWLSDRPDELSQAIATFIGYGDETVLLFSRYAPTNPAAEADILRLHSSFTRLSVIEETEEDMPDGAVP
ncbi:MAG: hypothetical protein WBB01_25900 [Phormidesmis sp.]